MDINNATIGTVFKLDNYPYEYTIIKFDHGESISCGTPNFGPDCIFSIKEIKTLEKFGYIDYEDTGIN